MELTTPLQPRQCTPLLPTLHITGRHRGVKWWEKFIIFFSLLHGWRLFFHGTLDCIIAVYQGNLEPRGLSIFDYHVTLPTILSTRVKRCIERRRLRNVRQQTDNACVHERGIPSAETPQHAQREREDLAGDATKLKCALLGLVNCGYFHCFTPVLSA